MEFLLLGLFCIILFLLFRGFILGSNQEIVNSKFQDHNMPKRQSDSNIYQGNNGKANLNSNKKRRRNQPKASSKDCTMEIASISHKNTSGSDNWKTFLGLVSNTNNKHVKPEPNPTVKPSRKGGEKMPISKEGRKPKPNSMNQENSDTDNVGLKKKPVMVWSTDQASAKETVHHTPRPKPIGRTIDLTKNISPLSTVYTPEEDLLSNNKAFGPASYGKPKVVNGQPKLTKQIAIDCEMVGVEVGINKDMLARVSLVNYDGDCVYDKFVKPTEPILDYRTRVSGVRPEDLENATDFETVQKEISDIIKGRVLVGHALKNDFKVLFLSHPKYLIRDTSKFKKFREGRTPALKKLAKKFLGVEIQEGEHSSIQDALAAMQLYKMFKKEWELSIKTRKPYNSLGYKTNKQTRPTDM